MRYKVLLLRAQVIEKARAIWITSIVEYTGLNPIHYCSEAHANLETAAVKKPTYAT